MSLFCKKSLFKDMKNLHSICQCSVHIPQFIFSFKGSDPECTNCFLLHLVSSFCLKAFYNWTGVWRDFCGRDRSIIFFCFVQGMVPEKMFLVTYFLKEGKFSGENNARWIRMLSEWWIRMLRCVPEGEVNRGWVYQEYYLWVQ